jgi:NAD(P)-dependent dehydrogenase (short-subunit alcohol dehydrogenase family)
MARCVGLSQALSSELASFGIRVLVVEPGEMRTSTLEPATPAPKPIIPEAYKNTAADYVLSAILQMDGKQDLVGEIRGNRFSPILD